jgi:hypothetical protein
MRILHGISMCMFSAMIAAVPVILSAQPIVDSLGCNGTRARPRVYWEDLIEERKNAILSTNTVLPDAVEYYRGRFALSDDDRTFTLLDGMAAGMNQGGDLRSLYFYLLNQVCRESDGALAEVLAPYIARTILSDPPYVLTYLRGDSAIVDTYALHLGWEFAFKAKELSDLPWTLADFKQAIANSLSGEPALRPIMEELLRAIDRAFLDID